MLLGCRLLASAAGYRNLCCRCARSGVRERIRLLLRSGAARPTVIARERGWRRAITFSPAARGASPPGLPFGIRPGHSTAGVGRPAEKINDTLSPRVHPSQQVAVEGICSTMLRRRLGRCSTPFLFRLAAEPGHRNSQAASNGDEFVIHDVPGSIFDARNGGLVEGDASCGQFARQVVLRDRRTALEPSFANSLACHVFERGLLCSFHGKWRPTGRVQQNGERKVCGLRILLKIVLALPGRIAQRFT